MPEVLVQAPESVATGEAQHRGNADVSRRDLQREAFAQKPAMPTPLL